MKIVFYSVVLRTVAQDLLLKSYYIYREAKQSKKCSKYKVQTLHGVARARKQGFKRKVKQGFKRNIPVSNWPVNLHNINIPT